MYQQVERVMQSVEVKFDSPTGVVKDVSGSNDDLLKVESLQVYDVVKSKIGAEQPEKVFGELNYTTVKLNSDCRLAWEQLKTHDDVFMLSLNKRRDGMDNELDKDIVARYGIQRLIGSEVVAHLDEERGKINTGEFRLRRDIKPRGVQRYIQVNVDPSQYVRDQTSGKQFIYSLAIKRRRGGYNYHACLKMIQYCLRQTTELSEWSTQVVSGKPFDSSRMDQVLDKLAGKLPNMQLDHVSCSKDTFNRIVRLESLRSKMTHRQACSNRLTEQQNEAVLRACMPGLTIVRGASHTGKTEVAATLIKQLVAGNSASCVMVVTKSQHAIDRLVDRLMTIDGLRCDEIIQLGSTDKD